MPTLDRVLLSWPKVFGSAEAVQVDLSDTGQKRSWIQLAKTGSFTSNKYGKFEISRQDLAEMLRNYRSVTPLAPTQLAVDYDHLSMDPKKPGDGIAAGWFSNIELRNGGAELWGEVEWTPTAAERIANKEYRFVSPSFKKNYVSKETGREVGTTLLAAAITNHPFLEGMAAVMLRDDTLDLAFGDQFKKKTAGEAEDEEPDPFADDPFADVATADKKKAEPGEGEGDEKPADENSGDEETEAKQTDVWDTLESSVAAQAAGLESWLIDITGNIVTWRQGDLTFRATFTPDGVLGQPEAVSVRIVPVQAATPGTDPGTPAVPGAQPAPGAPVAPAVPGSLMPGQKQLSQTVTHLMPHVRPGEDDMGATFKLSDVNGAEVEVSADVLRALSDKIVPEGSVVVSAAKVTDMEAKVTSLSTQVETLATALSLSETEARHATVNAKLSDLVKAGRITPKIRDWAFKTHKDHIDLAAFDEWVDTIPEQPVIKLDYNHGSGADAHDEGSAPEASQRMLATAKQLVVDEKIPFRDALIKASTLHLSDANEYLDAFRPVH